MDLNGLHGNLLMVSKNCCLSWNHLNFILYLFYKGHALNWKAYYDIKQKYNN